ncbi:hypothetical protein [Absidia glauca]|uniref:RING-type E3 ubiquitin transferase n=1 Tax=Absidia glauca TaxID=4829 RepID=A0A163MVY9_ABSGL|nr:hypothetical protein [Absidia glauca]
MSLSLVDYGSSDSEDEDQQQQPSLPHKRTSPSGGLGQLLPPPKNNSKPATTSSKKSIFYIPSAKDLGNDNDEEQEDKPSKRLKLGSASTNLADLLPAPKNHQNPFRKPATPTPTPVAVPTPTPSTTTQPDDKDAKEEDDEDDDDEVSEDGKPVKSTSTFTGSFFNIGSKLKEKPILKSTSTTTTTTTTSTTDTQQQEQLPVLEDPNAMYAYGADPNAYYQYYYQQEQATEDTKETLGNDVLSQLGGKRRGEHAGVNIIDVNQTDILPTEEWRRHAEANQPIFAQPTSDSFDVNSLKKKKNNIMALAAQAKSMEHQLEERYAQERIKKAQARNRYGRLRSQSTSSPNYSASTPSSPLLSRGFASLRRSHRHTASATENRQSIAVLPSISTPRTNTNGSGNASSTNTNTNTANPNPNTPTPIQEHRIRLVPNVGTTTRCFVFDVIERTLRSGVVLKLGRYSDRNSCADRLSFKSKVVSRCHAELWQEDGKIYIKDSGSSSGTFVNRARLGAANTTSRPFVIQDGDLIQLGVDYKGGVQPMYRAVRIRFEVDRTPTSQQVAFSRVAFRQLKQCLRTSLGPTSNNTASSSAAAPTTADEGKLPSLSPEEQSQPPASTSASHPTTLSRSTSTSSDASSSCASSVEVQECCICLYSMGPGQALFITPCSHIYHYRCLRPILTQNFPGFSCPLCRTYSDLDTMVATEKEDMEQMLQLDRSNTHRKKSRKKTKSSHSDGPDEPTPPAITEEATSSSAAPPLMESDPQVVEGANLTPSSSPGLEDMVTSDTDMELRPSPDVCPIPQQRKSAGPEGLLATTLVGSPCPFELMIQATSTARPTEPSSPHQS